MNTIWIVLPILTLLMFDLGLTLEVGDFKLFRKRPRPIITGLIGQLFFLPIIAFLIGISCKLEAPYFIGIMLIACSPGGSSSNIFSMLAKGDVALSVSLTAFSSILTLFTIPIIMELCTSFITFGQQETIQLPISNLIIQNLVLMLLPILLGICIRKRFSNVASHIHKVLGKIAFPALILLATVFFIQHKETIYNKFEQLGTCITLLILLAMGGGKALASIMHLNEKEKRTLVIEIGMQNAAQAIAIATSPFIFNNGTIAIPAIIYALMMNIILLIYVGYHKYIVKN